MPEADYHAFMRLYSASGKTEELKLRFKRLNNHLDYRICKLANYLIYGKEGTGRNKKCTQTMRMMMPRTKVMIAQMIYRLASLHATWSLLDSGREKAHS